MSFLNNEDLELLSPLAQQMASRLDAHRRKSASPRRTIRTSSEMVVQNSVRDDVHRRPPAGTDQQFLAPADKHLIHSCWPAPQPHSWAFLSPTRRWRMFLDGPGSQACRRATPRASALKNQGRQTVLDCPDLSGSSQVILGEEQKLHPNGRRTDEEPRQQWSKKRQRCPAFPSTDSGNVPDADRDIPRRVHGSVTTSAGRDPSPERSGPSLLRRAIHEQKDRLKPVRCGDQRPQIDCAPQRLMDGRTLR